METGSGNEIPTVTSDEPNEVADMAVTVDCPEAGCTGGTDGAAWTYTGDAAIAAVMLDHHLRSHAQPGRQTEWRPGVYILVVGPPQGGGPKNRRKMGFWGPIK